MKLFFKVLIYHFIVITKTYSTESMWLIVVLFKLWLFLCAIVSLSGFIYGTYGAVMYIKQNENADVCTKNNIINIMKSGLFGIIGFVVLFHSIPVLYFYFVFSKNNSYGSYFNEL